MASARRWIAVLIFGFLLAVGGAAALSFSVHNVAAGDGERLALGGAVVAGALWLFCTVAVGSTLADLKHAETADQRLIAQRRTRDAALRWVADAHLTALYLLIYAARFRAERSFLQSHPLLLYLLILVATLGLAVNQAADMIWRRGWDSYTQAFNADGTPRPPEACDMTGNGC